MLSKLVRDSYGLFDWNYYTEVCRSLSSNLSNCISSADSLIYLSPELECSLHYVDHLFDTNIRMLQQFECLLKFFQYLHCRHRVHIILIIKRKQYNATYNLTHIRNTNGILLVILQSFIALLRVTRWSSTSSFVTILSPHNAIH